MLFSYVVKFLPLPLLSPLGYTCFDFEHALGFGRLEIGLKVNLPPPSVSGTLARTDGLPMDGGGGGSGDRGTLGELDVDEALGLPGGRAGGTAKLLRTTCGLAGGEGAEVRGGGGGGIGLCGELFDRVRPVVTDGTSEAWILGETPDATEGGAGGGGGGGDETVLEEGVGNARPGIGGALKFLGNVL